MADNDVSRLIQDLSSLPNIVGGLGISIASAQKAFNLDYLNNLERLLHLVKETIGQDDNPSAFDEVLKGMLRAMAPPRYQFTETELEFRADLAQSLKVQAGGSIGAGVGAVTVSASAAAGFGYEYQASARVKTVIHALPADDGAFKALLERASDLPEIKLPAAANVGVDKEILDKSIGIHRQLTGQGSPPAPADG